MKKNILRFAFAFALAIGSFALTSCSGETTETHEHTEGMKYACPMGCEGDKVHSEPGSCSVCGMDLVKEE